MRDLSMLIRSKGRLIALVMAFGAIGLGFSAVVLANLLRLDACHLCIFQRFVHFVIGLVLLFAFVTWSQRLVASSSLVTAAALSIWGMVASAQQSWMQWFPESGLSCAITEPGLTERFIDWLGQQYPLFFMATGSCESKDLVIFWLSLANWSFLAFLVFFATCIVLMFNRHAEGK